MVAQFEQQYTPYEKTGKFSKIVLDYLRGSADLASFYQHTPDLDGIRNAIENKKAHPVDRQLLGGALARQYTGLENLEAVKENIELLARDNTFTVCTAHQPNLFTGHLYFIYKIIHAIKLADTLGREIPDCNFVPVFFMGSEDADLDELNHIELEGKTYRWETKQQGAVGKMLVDEPLLQLIPAIEGRLLAEPFGIEIATLLKSCYQKGRTIEQSTFLFVHGLFHQFGLIVFLPDNPAFKEQMIPVFEDDLFNHTPSRIVNDTSTRLAAHHHAQAYARDINLFYMEGDLRNRITRVGDNFVVHDTDISFTGEAMREELRTHPERFSPNVILRGLFQEKVLPDIAFIGGGGELAYWLQLKDLFSHYGVPYPVLILRNSFTVITRRWKELLDKLQLEPSDVFQAEEPLLQTLVKQQTARDLSLEKEISILEKVYGGLALRAAGIDPTLPDHVNALQAKQLHRLRRLEKKFMSAEKKKHEATQRQLHKLLSALSPNGGLQERTDNFMLLYAMFGRDLFDQIYKAAPVWEPAFTFLIEEGPAKKVEEVERRVEN